MKDLREGGFALVWAVLSVALTTLLLSSFYSLIQGSLGRTSRRLVDEKCKSLAQSGMHFALAKLNQEGSFSVLVAPSWDIAVATASSVPPRTSPDFRLETDLPEDWRKIKVNARIGQVERTVEGNAAAIYHPRYPAGLLGLSEVSIEGLEADSFDGQAGSYNRSRSPELGQVWSFGRMEIVSHASTSIQGDCRAFGALTLGDLARGAITGRTGALGFRYAPPPVIAPLDAIPLQFKQGKAKLLSAGKYQIDRLVLDEKTRLICEGKVEIYASEVSLPSQGLVTTAEDPLAMQLLVSGSNVDVTPPFLGVIYAPKAQVRLTGKGDFLGAVVGDRIFTTPGVRLHFDRTLPRRTRGPRIRWQLKSWRS